MEFNIAIELPENMEEAEFVAFYETARQRVEELERELNRQADDMRV